ncbi:MAG: gliding motility-associated ABC transporter permease subunit GldF [Bacteroidetes bacterium RIFOXYA12_FULL_35_11]|nr:MAG: gliding motility-associated ABC transporter permease subunit GldF [Bacteroidetes bacterium GWF2_35_48]OFY74413.1 MAG: gliding motility-associated ABC transporter permease subunit GldF [Bacteroidetes bacterium RIFOXYA12_FULL_35_11]OFY96459.1 MAG: gliding motility-associated ABC transporter permease subunit GldF [Bacteroidetes bacterium RIFOXYB2_FULL_35_7]HBX50711.1 gliding motility-associated ABC transporter permease subunit GldF [Bacteroidales bacterium]
MLVLLNKEIREFFSNLMGYIVVIVFLLINSLFIWVFPGEFNLLDAGYANLDTLFIISPWVFLFLVPAITMRLFAEEKKTGTLDTLLIRPISDLQIVLAKFFAGVILVFVSLLPTIIYYFTIYKLGNPVGNLDKGGILGSYIGLFFLASVYISIGLFASSLTQNQIIAFIIGMLIAFFFYYGFDSIGTILPQSAQEFIVYLGINEHYRSISRGVVDTRDVVYFISIISIFIYFTKLAIESRKW